MTAPSSVYPQAAYYHASHHGGMFPPAAYSVAGFSQPFINRSMPPAAFAAANAAPIASTSAAGPAAYMNGGSHMLGDYGSQQTGAANHGRPPGSSSGLHDEHYGPAPPSSSGGMFSHYPPPLSGVMQTAQQYPMTAMNGHAVATMAGHPNVYFDNNGSRPGTATDPRRASNANLLDGLTAEDVLRARLGSSAGLRPDTGSTLRPDTAVSLLSAYSGVGPAYLTSGGAIISNAPSISQVATLDGPSGIRPTSSQVINTRAGSSSDPEQKYAFVPLPSNPKKRPRRRFEEIERIYDCSYPGCPKAYGTLNHLNAHVSMQKHGPKRLPAGMCMPAFQTHLSHLMRNVIIHFLLTEFKEIRKAWRMRQKAKQQARDAAAKSGIPLKDDGDGNDEDFIDDDEEQELDDSGHQSNTIISSNDVSLEKPATPPPIENIVPTATFTGGSGDSSGSFTSSMFGYTPDNWLQSAVPQGNYVRPSTAPSQTVYHGFGNPQNFSIMPGGNVAINGISQVGPNFLPMNNVQRRASLNSLQPVFASIQEEEDPSLLEANGELAQILAKEQNVPSPETPSTAMKQNGDAATQLVNSSVTAQPTPSYPAGMMAFSSFLNSPSDVSSARPSTAPSPFRYNASTFASTAGLDSLSSAYDMLDKAGSFGTPHDETPDEGADSWSPEWRALTSRTSVKSEVH